MEITILTETMANSKEPTKVPLDIKALLVSRKDVFRYYPL